MPGCALNVWVLVFLCIEISDSGYLLKPEQLDEEDELLGDSCP
jgi:hypothetical protein